MSSETGKSIHRGPHDVGIVCPRCDRIVGWAKDSHDSIMRLLEREMERVEIQRTDDGAYEVWTYGAGMHSKGATLEDALAQAIQDGIDAHAWEKEANELRDR